ncbi:MAG: OmpA family protein [Candidatus Sulfotelmatobacter sp.]
MSARFNLNMGPIAAGVLIVLPILLILSRASAQSDPDPEEDLFVGYQWLHPGALPAPSVAPSAICFVQPNEVTVGEPITCTDSRGLRAQASTQVVVENPPPPKPEIEVMEARLSLRSIYFPTAMPPIRNPNAWLVVSQRQTLFALAADFKKDLESKPEAYLILESYADPRGPAEYNQKLSERRVDRVRSFLIQQGLSEAEIDTKAFGALRRSVQ